MGYVADVIGLMTGISAERKYIRNGNITRMILMELTDERCDEFYNATAQSISFMD